MSRLVRTYLDLRFRMIALVTSDNQPVATIILFYWLVRLQRVSS